ncbi:MAG: anaerobic ribonucleoside-triphosphate reductase, partial [Lactobacillus delbrueckii]
MLKPAAETVSLNFANAPKKFIKRDGAPFKFEQFKLEMVLDELGLEDSEIKAAVLSKVYAKLASYTVDAVQVHAAFRASLNELGYLNEAKEYEAKRQEDEADWRAETDTKQRLAKLVDKDPSIVHENANKDSDVFATQRDLTAGTVGKTVGLTLMPQHIAKAHLRGDIHWHDLDYTPLSPMSNCCLIDFDYMLNHGFKIGNAFVEVPNSIRVATSQVAQIITSVASSQYGGCSFDRCDEVLAPFAEKDYKKHLEEGREFIDDEDKVKAFAKKRTQKDIYDAMQSLEYEINTMFSSQGQTPFTTLGFGLGTNWIEREIQKDILQVRIEGLGREHRTAIFPKLVFSLKKGFNLHPGDPNYDIKKLALECA